MALSDGCIRRAAGEMHRYEAEAKQVSIGVIKVNTVVLAVGFPFARCIRIASVASRTVTRHSEENRLVSKFRWRQCMGYRAARTPM